MDAKPIFIIKVSDNILSDKSEELFKQFRKKWNDYHTLIITTDKDQEPEFLCFNVKDLDEIKFDELKEIVLNAIAPYKFFCNDADKNL
jgi:hypothetical protein